MPKKLLLAVLGLAVISWAVLSAGPTGATGNTEASLQEEGYSSSLALDYLDRPVVSFHGNVLYGNVMFCGILPCGRQELDGDLKILRCANPNCASVIARVVPDGTDNVGQFSSLELDAADNPVVSYYDVTKRRLEGDPLRRLYLHRRQHY